MGAVLFALHQSGTPQYASALDIVGTVQAISSALRHAKDRGLVSALRGETRRRSTLWSLTPRGRRIVAAVVDAELNR